MNEGQVERISQNLGRFMRVIHIMKNRSEKAGMKPLPLDPQYVMLSFLKDGPLPMSDLSRRGGCSKPNVTALTGRLIDDGLAAKQQDRGDRRVIRIGITKRGMALLERRKKAARAAIRANLSGLSEKDLDELCVSLEKVNRIIAKLGSD
jgi:DNA-binding MarR family transcriptional regulator